MSLPSAESPRALECGAIGLDAVSKALGLGGGDAHLVRIERLSRALDFREDRIDERKVSLEERHIVVRAF